MPAIRQGNPADATARAVTLLLVPDASAARRVRRLVAARGAHSGVVVGSWPELLDWARQAYLVPAPAADWDETFRAALGALEDAFWYESLSVAPDETSAAVGSALVEMISASDPAGTLDAQGMDGLPERPRRHVADLLRLHASLAGRLPDALATIRDLLAADASEALHTLRVHHVESIPVLTRWQKALIAKLNRDAEARGGDDVPGEDVGNILTRALADNTNDPARGALGVLRTRLFEVTDDKAELDESVQWVGVRDFLQEAEVAAGMVQSMLADDPELKAADIGLLLPDSFEYSVAVEDAFALGGLALSGLPAERWRRDLGREVVFHFLYCRHKPAPAMALAVCLASPLMPWSRADGAVLAQTVMDGDYRLRPPRSAGAEARAMLALLRDGDGTPATLARALQEFAALLDGADAFAAHLQRARAAAEQVRALLATAAVIDWAGLRRAVSPRFTTSGETSDFNLEGITVWRESQEPWRPVRRLLVLGFAQGHYPVALGASPVFSADDLQAMQTQMGLPVRTPADVLARRRARLKRQLGRVAESVTFLTPRRDFAAAAQAPSESLVFMHQLFVAPSAVESLLLELDAAADREHIRHLALAAAEPPLRPLVRPFGDLHFAHDLLALRTDARGDLKPESPSSLETLMVSPLAWLLRRLGAEPLQWAPESADVRLLGTLAHEVFENLFPPGAPLPARDRIPGRAEALLDNAINRLAPFLRSAPWEVERRHVAAGIGKAAQAWRDVLEQLGAEVLANEAWLQGTWAGIPIHGQADTILGLPGDRLLVVDHKRSRSNKRRPRMEKGYDSQASLYRAMLESGGPKDGDNTALIERLRAAAHTGIVYYMLNDQVALSDTVLPGSGAVPGWQALENDIAGQAMALIRQRLDQVRAGDLRLNRTDDPDFFEKEAGVAPYALENSPLIGLFTLPAEAAEAP